MTDNDQSTAAAVEASPSPWRSPPTGRTLPVERTKPLVWIALVALAVALCAVAVFAGHRQEQILSGANPALEQVARERVTRDLVDPSSAQFRNVKVSGECVTGQINAKNAFGGYVGFKDFYYNGASGIGAVAPDPVLTSLASDGDRFAGVAAEGRYNLDASKCLSDAIAKQ